ncbi:MAG: hypothetical protein HY397_03105 [Candidatus Doudnabacteria bacterium]|nr:hypothetical protein [Candidatus Doudnabacteria bacterium]
MTLKYYLGDYQSKAEIFLTGLLCAIIFFAAAPQAQAGTRSKSAYNQTQGINAQSGTADAGDVIVYTLSYYNSSNFSETITFEDDIADVLYASDLVNLGGGSLQGTVLQFPSVSVAASSRADKSFSVQVKNLPANTQDTLMSNTFGNGVDVKLRVTPPPKDGTVKGAFTAPATGVAENTALVLAGISTLLYVAASKIRLRRSRV